MRFLAAAFEAVELFAPTNWLDSWDILISLPGFGGLAQFQDVGIGLLVLVCVR